MQRNISDRELSPEDHIKHDLVKLRRETGDHFSKSYKNDNEKYAFCKKTKIFITSLEPYTDKSIVLEIMNHYKELTDVINNIKNNKSLDDKTKQANILHSEFEYAEPVYFAALRIFHHSPIVELEAQGILRSKDKDIKNRVRDTKSKLDMFLEETDEEDNE